ncbi:glycosyltransferase [Paenibacillus enshidis]|uniref:Glycosyltransferase n=1 Tax=Paenibacillus enshidis TaxID=1458439 RepID=A0ABV5AVI5_9BACL
MKKKNILFIGAFQEPGGEEEVITYLFKNVDQSQFTPYLCGPARADFFQKHSIGKEQLLDLEMKNIYDIKSINKLRHYIDHYDIDIVHSHGSRGGLFGRVAGFLSKKKPVNIWTLHLLINENRYTISKSRRLTYTMIESVLGKIMTDQIITVSNDLRRKYEQLHNIKNIITIHNGIDIQKYNYEKPNNNTTDKNNILDKKSELTFGFVSRLSKQKGIPYLIQAFNQVVKDPGYTNRIKLQIVGTGDQEMEVRRMVKELELEAHVSLLGFRTDIPEILASIDVLVLPSMFEGFPMVILESLCAGTPVIASSVNGVPEVIQHHVNGLLVEPRNVEQLAESMKFYLDHPEKIIEHGKQGQSLVHHSFTKEVMMNKHMDLYQSLLQVN